MPTQLFLEERRRWILEELKRHGRVSVSELSEKSQVSAVTIRQDLKALEGDGLLERTHGGAVEVLSRPLEEPELSFDIRRNRQKEEKDALGRAAAQLVESGFAIALDASTTICSVVPYLAHLDSLTIVTNNLMVPELVLSQTNVELYLPAGRLRRDSYSVIGNPASLPEINLNIGFVSAWGISPEAGLTEVNEYEMRMKQALLSRCMMKIAILDSSKWGRVAPHTYAHQTDLDLIITTDRVPSEVFALYNSIPIQVITIR